MARQPGSANFSGTIEALAGGPLDARSIVKTKADLTAVGSFEYPYIGMETYVVSENKKYRLIGDNPLVAANWEEVGSVILDEEIDDTSENGVQNKVIAEALKSKADLDEDGKVVASQLRERELHQAEYDALTEEEKMNGTTYYIDDSIDEGSATAVCGFTPIGTIISVMGTVAPRNYIACNGQVVNIDTYPELANYFEQQFGSKNKFGGDGVTTFGIPDLRGEFLRGTGTNSHANQGSGAEVGTHQDSTYIPQTFGNYSGSSSSNIGIPIIDGHSNNGSSNADKLVQLDSNGTVYPAGTNNLKRINVNSASVNIAATGVTGTHSAVRPTNTSVLYCIAVRNIYIDAKYDYSTDEKVVGTWIDGKPIYQKTIFCGQNAQCVTNGTRVLKDVAHNIINLERVINAVGSCYQNQSTTPYSPITCMQLPLNSSDTTGTTFGINATNITLRNNNISYNSLTNIYITVQYTKTTD